VSLAYRPALTASWLAPWAGMSEIAGQDAALNAASAQAAIAAVLQSRGDARRRRWV